MKHVRAAGLCARGTRAWFERHDLSFREFCTRGLPVETIEATRDAFGLKVAAIAREDASHG